MSHNPDHWATACGSDWLDGKTVPDAPMSFPPFFTPGVESLVALCPRRDRLSAPCDGGPPPRLVRNSKQKKHVDAAAAAAIHLLPAPPRPPPARNPARGLLLLPSDSRFHSGKGNGCHWYSPSGERPKPAASRHCRQSRRFWRTGPQVAVRLALWCTGRPVVGPPSNPASKANRVKAAPLWRCVWSPPWMWRPSRKMRSRTVVSGWCGVPCFAHRDAPLLGAGAPSPPAECAKRKTVGPGQGVWGALAPTIGSQDGTGPHRGGEGGEGASRGHNP